MALAHTILAVLIQSPGSGYDVSKCFEEDLGCYWQASQQQIYRELGKMQRQGWVEHETVPQEGKPDKKIYTMTPAGEAELRRWYSEPTEPTAIREDLLVKVLLGPYLPKELLVAELQHRQQMHRNQLLKYRELEAMHQSSPQPSQTGQYRYLTLRRGIRYEQDWIDWCDEVLDFLSREKQDAEVSS